MKNIKKLLALLLSACLLLSCLAALAEENDVNVWENGDTLNAGKIDTNGNAGIMIEDNYDITVENGKQGPTDAPLDNFTVNADSVTVNNEGSFANGVLVRDTNKELTINVNTDDITVSSGSNAVGINVESHGRGNLSNDDDNASDAPQLCLAMSISTPRAM